MSKEVSNQVTNIALNYDSSCRTIGVFAHEWLKVFPKQTGQCMHEVQTSENEGVYETHTLAQRSNKITTLEFLLSLGYAKKSITQAEQLSQLHGKPRI